MSTMTTAGRMSALGLGLAIAMTVGGLAPPAPARPATGHEAPDGDRAFEHDVAAIETLARTTVTKRANVPFARRAALVAPCAELSYGDVYCLGLGFRSRAPRYDRLVAGSPGRSSGDLTFGDWVEQRWAMSSRERVAAQIAEVGDVRASLDKAMAVRAFLAASETERPLTTMDSLAAQDAEAGGEDLNPPDGHFGYIMGGHATKQHRSYWCGPATFQMIDWADDGTKQTQAHWADELGTTSAGTAITSMVKLTNSRTSWDEAAGKYEVQGVGPWDADKFFNVHKAHLGDSTPAPIIEHPRLLMKYFSYLSENGNGHFQVGRGFADPADPDLPRTIGIFEPWNEADWRPGGKKTWGPHNVLSSRLLLATKANTSFKNIGL